MKSPAVEFATTIKRKTQKSKIKKTLEHNFCSPSENIFALAVKSYGVVGNKADGLAPKAFAPSAKYGIHIRLYIHEKVLYTTTYTYLATYVRVSVVQLVLGVSRR